MKDFCSIITYQQAETDIRFYLICFLPYIVSYVEDSIWWDHRLQLQMSVAKHSFNVSVILFAHLWVKVYVSSSTGTFRLATVVLFSVLSTFTIQMHCCKVLRDVLSLLSHQIQCTTMHIEPYVLMCITTTYDMATSLVYTSAVLTNINWYMQCWHY